ncbi:MAG: hypothetical protein KC668_19995 [Myxococcales bacterium]|nr:hypothetical protein [Myxococcales bacterium]
MSDTHDWQTAREKRGVVVQVSMVGWQEFPPQSAISVAGMHATQVPPLQRGRPGMWLQWASMVHAAHSPMVLHWDSDGVVQSRVPVMGLHSVQAVWLRQR